MITVLRSGALLVAALAAVVLATGEWLLAQPLTPRGHDVVHWAQVTGLALAAAVPLMLWVAASWETP